LPASRPTVESAAVLEVDQHALSEKLAADLGEPNPEPAGSVRSAPPPRNSVVAMVVKVVKA